MVTSEIYVNGQPTGLDSKYYASKENVSAEFLKTHVPRRIEFRVLNNNDVVTIDFRNLTRVPAGELALALNAFELEQL